MVADVLLAQSINNVEYTKICHTIQQVTVIKTTGTALINIH